MVHVAGKTVWAGPRLERCKALYLEGQSASQIAGALTREFRHPITRSAVIGIIHREGWRHAEPRPPARPGPAPRARAPAVPSLGRGQYQRPPRPPAGPSAPKAPTPIPEPVVAVRPRMLPLEALEPGDCRWPVGSPEPRQLFCGSRAGDGPYCAEHSRVAHQRQSALAKPTPNELARSLRRYL